MAATSRRDLELVCRRALLAILPASENEPLAAEFYPYVGLSHTIRRRGRGWVLRISDHCVGAPEGVIDAIATILGSKVAGRRPPGAAHALYDGFRRDPDLVARIRARRLSRGRKRLGPSPGVHHALEEIFRDLSACFFGGRLEVARLGWGTRPSWTRLGHYDPLHDTITISPVLDSPEVPRHALGLVLYHEMLHALFALRSSSARPGGHPPEFRRAERDYPGFEAARRFLGGFCRGRGRGRAENVASGGAAVAG
jgi:hypothetical protein